MPKIFNPRGGTHRAPTMTPLFRAEQGYAGWAGGGATIDFHLTQQDGDDKAGVPYGCRLCTSDQRQQHPTGFRSTSTVEVVIIVISDIR